MPTDLLFDLSAIDLDHIEVSRDDVGEVNPQCGDMRQLDHVICVDIPAKRALGVKHVTDQEFWVPLHIPGRPLMPGVLMIEAAAQLCSVYFSKRAGVRKFLGFTRCDNTVFRAQVVPGDTLYLLALELRFKARRLECRTQGVVDGRLVFESKITGMAM